MNPQKWQKIKEIFNQALELSAPERPEFIAKTCAEDEEMRLELDKMLAFAEDDHDALEENALNYLTDEKDAPLPEKIGAYRILREIGRGGMGVVYEAVRETKDFRQKVALKVIKRGMDTDAILSRFRHEQQILATLVHPNIARFLDGGMTADGLAFYAMEFVEGQTLDEFAEKQNLGINERLELFRQICSAVQFAHKNFVIHRDLKPSNIIVTSDGTPKLLDFGISKILSEESDGTIGTATALGMMTPAYASPEQIRGERVNTATDIYSLGIILCELLTGQKPYRVNSNSQPDLIRAICESEPLKPSSLATINARNHYPKTKDQAVDTISEINPKAGIQNLKSLRGDLDNIVLKALRKEPENRYASVEQFSEDIHRYLVGLPIIARSSTLKYRVSKFIHRNRLAAVAGVLIFLSLVAGIAVASWQAYVARKERQIAERRFEDVRQLANKVVFKYHDAIANLVGATEAREMLVRDATEYLDKLSQDAQDHPSLAQELALSYLKIGDVQGQTYRANIGDSKGALESYRKSISLLENLVAREPQNLEYLKSLREAYRQLAYLTVRLEDWASAEYTSRREYELSKSIYEKEPQNVDYQLNLAQSYQIRGDAAVFAGGYEASTKLFRESLVEAEKVFQKNPNHERAQTVLVVAYQRLGTHLEYYANYLKEKGEDLDKVPAMYIEAEQLHRRTVEMSYKLKEAHPQSEIYSRFISATEINWGTALARIGRGTEGIPLIEKSLVGLKQAVAGDAKNAEAKRDVAECYQYLAFAYEAMNLPEKAIAANQESLKILEEITIKDPTNVEFFSQAHLTFNNTGNILTKEGKLTEALNFYQKGLAYVEKMSGFNNSSQVVLFRSESNRKIGETYLAMAAKDNNPEKIKLANSYLTKAQTELTSLQQKNQLGKSYIYKLDLIRAKIENSVRVRASL